MKKRQHRKKALTVAGAVVVAGLTPGIIGATPGCLPVQATNAEITAAQMVAIDGRAYSFDELYAMQQSGSRSADPQVATRYGVRPATSYGVTTPAQPYRPREQKVKVKSSVSTQRRLVAYCAKLIDADRRGIFITLDSDLTRELGMDEDQLKALAAEIKECYGVEVSYRRFYLVGQLNTLRLVSEYIYKIKHLRD